EVVLKDDSDADAGAAGEDYSLDASIVFSAADVKLPAKDQIAALQKRLKLLTRDRSYQVYIDQAWSYMNEASSRA
ncbi:MAG: hypothetical protein ACU0CO_18140, partial [Shimia sp.]